MREPIKAPIVLEPPKKPEGQPSPASGFKRLGLHETAGFELGDAFWEPLPEDELRYWDGYMDEMVDPLHPDSVIPVASTSEDRARLPA